MDLVQVLLFLYSPESERTLASQATKNNIAPPPPPALIAPALANVPLYMQPGPSGFPFARPPVPPRMSFLFFTLQNLLAFLLLLPFLHRLRLNGLMEQRVIKKEIQKLTKQSTSSFVPEKF